MFEKSRDYLSKGDHLSSKKAEGPWRGRTLVFELISRALNRDRTLNLKYLCKCGRISRSGYYYHIAHKPQRIKRDESSLELIKKYFSKSRGKAGIRTIDMMIRNHETSLVNHKKISRIKKEHGLYKSFPISENSNVPNLLQRNFITPIPNQIYSTDMTYLFYGSNQRAYLSTTKDLATNEIVSYRLMRKPTINQFIDEFNDLLKNHTTKIRSSLMIHSDQGFQYTHSAFRKLLIDHGVTQSMSRRGNCLDNAPIESFFGHFKDLLNLKECRTYEELEQEINWTMNYYNFERPQAALNKKPPVVYRGLINCFF